MAIQNNRLTAESIASLVKVDFDTKEESVAATTSSETSTANTPSSLDKKPNVTTSPSDAAQGIHKADANTKYSDTSGMSKIVKTKQAIKSNDRKFDSGNKLLTPISSNLKPTTPIIDNYLENTKVLKPTHDILSSKVSSKLDNIVKVELGNVKLGTYGLTQYDIANNVKAKLVTSIGGSVGATNLTKLSIDNLINDCFRGGFGYNIGDSDFLSMLVTSAFLDMISCSGVANAIAMIKEMMGTTAEGRYLMLGSIKNSLNKNNDAEVVNKLLLTKVIIDEAESDKERDALSIQSRGITKNVLKNLNNSNYRTNSTSSDYKNITEGLDALDPNWKKDEDGNDNYYKVKNNSKLSNLARSDLSNRYDPPATLGGPVTTNIDTSLGIAIINR
jgi:multidrug efflux pump subunit AcrB